MLHATPIRCRYRPSRRDCAYGLRVKLGQKIFLVTIAVLLCAGVALFEYAVSRDQAHFKQARNQCERDCIQDSGGPQFCRDLCAKHPDHYP
jgi:hypothetical protein